jgi:predicted MFS family arabinose efflux permease
MNKRILFSASLFHALNDAAGVIVPLTFPLLYSQGRLISSYSRIGILSNLGLLVTLVFQVFIAQASGRFEFRHFLLGSVAGIALSLWLLTTATNFLALLSFYCLFRLFTSFYHPLGVAWVSRTHPSRAIDRAMGIQGGSGDFGVFAAYIIAGLLLQKARWQTPLIVWGLASVALGGLSYLVIRGVRTRDQSFSPPRLAHWLETLGLIRGYVPGFALTGGIWAVTVYYAPSLFNHKFHVPPSGTGFYLALWIGLGTIMTFLFGRLSRALGRPALTLLGCTFSGLALILLGLTPVLSGAVLGVIALGISLFVLYPVFHSYVGNAVPHQHQALAFSLVANIQVLSGAIVALGAGLLADRFGLGSPFLVLGGFGLSTALFYSLRLFFRPREARA